ncbi:hypothetical protein [Flavobacterium cyclinae]|uniref:hypothetical protein n=1 Tax=Flavobacterium cyclinae TaxID=2895947 RepID=UPI001E51CBFC|nr:hypothetical protein [Flavobacterium cyclinae]UGS22096.1 hypothetical protein LOS86_05595 [Flavobacterium cyclinae]
MNEFKQKLEETLNRLYKENKLSIDAYSELMEFADPNQNLQLQQTGVIVRSEQLKTCEHNFADIYDHTGTQIVGKKCLNNCGF